MAIAAALGRASPAAALGKDQCIDANSGGQKLRLAGQFAAARERFEACTDPSCPAIVRDDCARRLNDLDRAQPTVLFDAGASSAGAAVRVGVDGVPLADRLDGTPLRVDPGEHVFTFAADGRAPVTLRLVVREGEKDRRERVALPAAVTAPPVPLAPASSSAVFAATSPVDEPPAPRRARTARIVAFTLGGAGLAAAAVGGVFGGLTFAAASRQKSDCSSGACPARASALSDHDTAVTDGAVSDVAFAAGGTLLALGLTFYLTGPSGHAAPASGAGGAGLTVVSGIVPGGGGIALRGELP